MKARRCSGPAAGKWLAAGVGLAAASYATYVAATWYRYGHVTHQAGGEDADAVLDKFMPTYEVVERHHVRVDAPAQITLAAATEMDLQQSAVVRAIFKGREWIMGSHPPRDQETRALLSQMRAIGWGVLAEIPGREIVMGAVTQPWMADVVFRALPPDEFAAFHEPDYVKIAWTLRADPIGRRIGLPDRDARGDDRSDRARAVPVVLVVLVARDHRDSVDVAQALEGGSRAQGARAKITFTGCRARSGTLRQLANRFVPTSRRMYVGGSASLA